MGPEKKFEEQVKNWLKGLAFTWFIKIHGTAATGSGIPDILASVGGNFVALEIKSESGRLSEIQKAKLKDLHNSGALAYVVKPSNFESVKADIEILITFEDCEQPWANNETHLCAMGVLDV